MREVLVQVIWRIDNKRTVFDEFTLIGLPDDTPFTMQMVSSHIHKSTNRSRIVYDYRAFTIGRRLIRDFVWEESCTIWPATKRAPSGPREFDEAVQQWRGEV